MALSALKQCRSIMHGSSSIRSFASSTTPKFAPPAAATGAIRRRGGLSKEAVAKLGSDWPVLAVLLGMMTVAGGIGVHTAMQHIFRNPSVHVTKKMRECMSEVDYADNLSQSGQSYVSNSFLRKVAHIQDNANTNDMRANTLTRSNEGAKP